MFVLSTVALMLIPAMADDSAAHTNIPKGDIPGKIPADVKQQIERLYSSNIEEQVRACYRLGQMGERAEPAVPFLIGLLGSKYLFEEMSPDEAAAKALVKIGKPAVLQLMQCVKDENPCTRERQSGCSGA